MVTTKPYGTDMEEVFLDGEYVGLIGADPNKSGRYAAGFNGLFGYTHENRQAAIDYVVARYHTLA